MNNQVTIADVERVTAHKVRLSWRTPVAEAVRIYIGEKADNRIDNKVLLSSTTSDHLELECNTERRQYFLLEIGKQTYVTTERVLPLEGACNFRDVGGYLTEDGRRVKWGLLYRSDHLHNLTDHDVRYLRTAHFHSIIDYRNEKEYSKQPNRVWDANIRTFNLIPDASSAELAAKASNDHDKIQQLIELTQRENSAVPIDGSGYIMQEQNRDFVRNPETAIVYRELIDIILDINNMPMVQHCRGGKDRTGFGIAIILAILGVKRALILQDYGMTGELRHPRNLRRMAEYQKETDNPDVLAFLFSMMETRNSYLEAAFTEMETHFGSIDGYLEKALHVTAAEREKIKSLYLY